MTRDKVDFLAGFVLTPNALAAADIASEAKVPLVITKAATSVLTAKSPYVAAYAEAYGHDIRPNFMSVGGYNGMAAIDRVTDALKGNIEGDSAMAVLEGMRIDSPRGPIEIDAGTRDIVQTVYVRRVEKVGGRLVNREFDQIADVKDPGKP